MRPRSFSRGAIKVPQLQLQLKVDTFHRNRKPSIKTKKATVKQNLNDKLKVSNAEILAFSYACKLHRSICVIEADF